MDDLEILDLEEGAGETGEVSNLCLVGKVLNPKIINSIAITNICTTAWKTRSPFSVTPWNNNVFLFRFEEAEDRELIHGLPVEKMTRANAEIIGKRFPKLLAIEINPTGIMLDRSFLRVRVEINLELPILKGFWLSVKSALKKDLWISCKYEKLSDLCFACGRFGHDNRSCRFTPRNEGLNFGYGLEIRAQGVRRSNIPIKVIRHEVDMAEIRVAKLLERRPLVQGEGSGSCLPRSSGTCLGPSCSRQN
ncbi:hypothetical protein RHMOL_Rhmol07G0207600 [Rhododendron molle]|uniref:Uncharacterized protein n=1 Tax=Rhododendron molle TaxID=49168 RepID=A0ACC0N346_RHOML|nr:hypothetical protein RHMOL_Rhmol07G0207600 [Rhododendron molle]